MTSCLETGLVYLCKKLEHHIFILMDHIIFVCSNLQVLIQQHSILLLHFLFFFLDRKKKKINSNKYIHQLQQLGELLPNFMHFLQF